MTKEQETNTTIRLEIPRDVLIVMNLTSYLIPKNLQIPLKRNSDILELKIITHIHLNNKELVKYINNLGSCDIVTNISELQKSFGSKRVVISEFLIDSQKIDLIEGAKVKLGGQVYPNKEDLAVLKAVINECYLQNKVIPVRIKSE